MAASRPDDASARTEPKQVIAVYDGWGIAAGALVISRSTPASRAAKHVVMSRDDGARAAAMGVGCYRDAAKKAAAVVGGAIFSVSSPAASGWSGLDKGLHGCMSTLCGRLAQRAVVTSAMDGLAGPLGVRLLLSAVGRGPEVHRIAQD